MVRESVTDVVLPLPMRLNHPLSGPNAELGPVFEIELDAYSRRVNKEDIP